MFGAILITIVITALGMTVVFQRYVHVEQKREYNRVAHEKENLERQITERKTREIRRNERDAYNQGLYDARKTDTLYRQILSKYASGEQVTVMMNGDATVATERK